jgi:hypothetical protein
MDRPWPALPQRQAAGSEPPPGAALGLRWNRTKPKPPDTRRQPRRRPAEQAAPPDAQSLCGPVWGFVQKPDLVGRRDVRQLVCHDACPRRRHWLLRQSSACWGECEVAWHSPGGRRLRTYALVKSAPAARRIRIRGGLPMAVPAAPRFGSGRHRADRARACGAEITPPDPPGVLAGMRPLLPTRRPDGLDRRQLEPQAAALDVLGVHRGAGAAGRRMGRAAAQHGRARDPTSTGGSGWLASASAKRRLLTCCAARSPRLPPADGARAASAVTRGGLAGR